MLIKIIDFGYKHLPNRAHYNDSGADVYACFHDCPLYALKPHETVKVPLGLGIELPDGYTAYVFPRSGLSSKGITTELAPIDSGYRGEIHAIVHNGSNEPYIIQNDDRIGQLVILPIVIAEFVSSLGPDRADSGFGSTGQ